MKRKMPKKIWIWYDSDVDCYLCETRIDPNNFADGDVVGEYEMSRECTVSKAVKLVEKKERRVR